jgi:hypothetical protein
VLSPGSKPRNPDGQSQPRVVSTRSASLDLSTSRVPKLRCRASTPPGLHYVSGVPLCHVRFGTSRIAEPTTPSPLLLKSPTAESPILRIRATCPSRNRRSRSNRGIALRDFDVHGILALTNPDSPICDDQGFFRCLRVNSLAPSPRSNDPRTSRVLPDDSNSSILFLYEEIPSSATFLLCDFHWVDFSSERKELSFLSFILKNFQKALKSNTLWALRAHGRSRFNPSFSDLLLRLDLDLHSPARLEILNPTLGEERNKRFNYLASSTHSMRRYSTALDAGISRPKQRNN